MKVKMIAETHDGIIWFNLNGESPSGWEFKDDTYGVKFLPNDRYMIFEQDMHLIMASDPLFQAIEEVLI